jgi:hypothetical protein
MGRREYIIFSWMIYNHLIITVDNVCKELRGPFAALLRAASSW